eukprot:3370046-Pleurochrysis_carterae.AAC.1
MAGCRGTCTHGVSKLARAFTCVHMPARKATWSNRACGSTGEQAARTALRIALARPHVHLRMRV